MIEPVAQRATWDREFWGELVYRTSTLLRRENEADLLGWHVRLVWDDARRGVVYLHRNVTAYGRSAFECDARRFVFTSFDARREARLLLEQLGAASASVKA